MIAFAIMGLFALVALAMDGGHAFSDRRQAQNACDAAALAAALIFQNNASASVSEIENAALSRALSNGYPNLLPRSTVSIDGNGTPVVGMCPGNKNGKEFVVTIDSYVDTWFGPIIGVSQVHNRVTSTARSCEYHYEPFFSGNTIVSVGPAPAYTSFSAGGNTDVRLECDGSPAGGVFANGNVVKNGGSSDITAPSMTVVGTGATQFTSTDIDSVQTVPASSGYAYPGDIVKMMPPQPACDGTAHLSGGKWYPESGKDGSKIPVDWDGGQTYAAGVYCVESIGNNFSGTLIATEGSTFYINDPHFDLKLAGSGDGIQIVAPTTGDYAGYAIIMPFTCTGGVICDQNQLKANPPTQTVDACTSQSDKPRLDLRGNGSTGILGAIWAPSACLTLLGNSGTTNRGQIVGFSVETSGSSDLSICYKAPENPKEFYPPTLELIK